MTENDPISPLEEQDARVRPTFDSTTVAPAWHTIVLTLGIVALSIGGRAQIAHLQPVPNRLGTYATTAILEMVMLGWVIFGLRLREIPLRDLFGQLAGGVKGLALDATIAFAFWIASLAILGTIGMLWTSIEAIAEHRNTPFHGGEPIEPSLSEKQTVRTLEQLAPANGKEVTCWVVLCCLAGLIEETVFRGYLQRQFTAWAHGRVVAGVAFSAVLFGGAHGYQGARNIVLLAVFGALFSLLAIFRRSLRAGIFAHSWHDLIAGLALAFMRAHHVV